MCEFIVIKMVLRIGVVSCLWVFMGERIWVWVVREYLYKLILLKFKRFCCVLNETKDGYVCFEYLSLKGWEGWRRAWGLEAEGEK